MAMMISKFHKLIQSKIVWGAFALLISIAFVSVSVPGSKSRSAAKQARKKAQLAGRLFGEDVTRSEFGHAWNSIRVMVAMYSMMDRRFDMDEEQMLDAAWLRLATLKKAQQLGMTASGEQTKKAIQEFPLFQNPETGQFNQNDYNMFVNQILPQFRMSSAGFEQVFRENVLAAKVANIPAQGGLVFEEEIKKAFHLYTDMLTVEYAAIPRSLADVPKVGKEEALNYFEINKEQFRMPEKAIVDYVQFAVADHLASVEVTDEMVAEFYENNQQHFLKPPAEDAAPDAEPEFKALEDVKDEIATGIQMQQARRIAADLADELVSELADETMTFEKAAQKLGLEIVDTTPAFTAIDPVKDIDPTAPFQRASFALQKDETHYYSDPVVGRDFVYVISLTKKLSSFLPSFEVVQDAATEAAKFAATERAYIEKAKQIHREIKEALKEGSAFSDAVAKYQLELKITEPFSITSTLEDEFGQQIMVNAIRVDQGKITELIATTDEYLVAYVAEKVLGDEAVALPAMRAELVGSIGNEKSGIAATTWREGLLKEAGFENLLIGDDES